VEVTDSDKLTAVKN